MTAPAFWSVIEPALDLMRERGEITGADLRKAGHTRTATGGAALLLEAERSGLAVRTARGWRATSAPIVTANGSQSDADLERVRDAGAPA